MIQILLCDDNLEFLTSLQDRIRKILSTVKTPASIYTYDDPQAIPQKMLATASIFFLDIDFSNNSCSGLDVAKAIRQHSSDAIIIFLTNYIQYAPEGYEVQAFRYLLKEEIPAKLENYLLDALSRRNAIQKKITVMISGKPTPLRLTEILYIKAQGHTVLIHTISQEGLPAENTYKLYTTMSTMEQELSPLGFLRTQKSYLVNMRHIDTYQCDCLILDNGTQLPVSEKFYANQKMKFLLWKGQH